MSCGISLEMRDEFNPLRTSVLDYCHIHGSCGDGICEFPATLKASSRDVCGYLPRDRDFVPEHFSQSPVILSGRTRTFDYVMISSTTWKITCLQWHMRGQSDGWQWGFRDTTSELNMRVNYTVRLSCGSRVALRYDGDIPKRLYARGITSAF